MLRSRFFVDVIAPALCVCWAAVFIYSAIAGEAGYGTLAELQVELQEKSAEVEALRARREALEKRANLLNSKSLDPDLVDERVRSVLGFSAEGDIIIPRDEISRLIDAADTPKQK